MKEMIHGNNYSQLQEFKILTTLEIGDKIFKI